jgi:hypothetical protein
MVMGKIMDFKNELETILNSVLELPLEMQSIVAEDIVESAKNRVATIKRIVQ